MSKKKFMNRIQVAIFAILAVFVMCSVSWAATYYVDATNGNNDNPGTFAEPWKTIGKANTTLVADDTVYIRTGTYEETIRPDNSGTEGNYITYAQYEDEEVTITGVSDGGDLTNRSYIVIDGFKIMHVSGNWIKLRPNGDHNIIRNCYMEGAGGWSGIYMGGQDSTETNYNQILDNTLIASLDSPCGPHDVIYLRDGGRYNLIEGNSISYSAHVAINIIWKVGDPGDPAPDMFNVIRNNTIQNKWHTSISTFPNGNATLIENNTILDSGEEYTENACGSERDRTMSRKDHKGIQHGARNSIIRHNVLINNGCMAVRTKGASWPSSINNRIYHNTFHENYYGIYSYGAPVYDNIFKNNIFFSIY